jgi:hypothetical protein
MLVLCTLRPSVLIAASLLDELAQVC